MDSSVRVIDVSQGEFLGVAGDNYRVIIDGAGTSNSFSVFDMTIPPGGGPTPHAHPNIQEFFYVTEGELEYKTEVENVIVKKGGFVYIPRGGAVHCFKNVSARTARVLCVVLPSGLEGFFKEFGVPVVQDNFPPPLAMTPDLLSKLDILNKKYGLKTYPADFLD